MSPWQLFQNIFPVLNIQYTVLFTLFLENKHLKIYLVTLFQPRSQ